MRALVWRGKGDVRCDTVPDPTIEDARDMQNHRDRDLRSDLPLYDGYMPTMEEGDILGHEPMGEVRRNRQGRNEFQGWRPCGGAIHDCLRQLFLFRKGTLLLLRPEQNRDAEKAAEAMVPCAGGTLGYSHLTGHYPGGQAEYLRVPTPMSARSRLRTIP